MLDHYCIIKLRLFLIIPYLEAHYIQIKNERFSKMVPHFKRKPYKALQTAFKSETACKKHLSL